MIFTRQEPKGNSATVIQADLSLDRKFTGTDDHAKAVKVWEERGWTVYKPVAPKPPVKAVEPVKSKETK